MNKEIEEVKNYFKKRIDICMENADICDDNNFDEEATCLRKEQMLTENILQYIEQLETKEQKLIEKLEVDNIRDTESVKRYEEMRRNCTNEFYLKSYQTTIHKLNAKREVRSAILSMIKGEEK